MIILTSRLPHLAEKSLNCVLIEFACEDVIKVALGKQIHGEVYCRFKGDTKALSGTLRKIHVGRDGIVMHLTFPAVKPINAPCQYFQVRASLADSLIWMSSSVK